MASIPPIVERCQTCGAELPSAAPLCWLCRTPRGRKSALPAAPPAPGFVLASNLFSYGMILAAGALVALMCVGLLIDTTDNAFGAIVLALVGGVPLLATLVRTVRRHQESGSASALDTFLTLLAYSAISVSMLTLLAFAAIGALVIWCFYELATHNS